MNLPFGFSVQADFHGEFLLFSALLIALVFVIFITNRRHTGSKDQLTGSKLWIILILRIVSVIILLLLVMDPQVTLERTRLMSKKIAVVVDHSRSMNNAWDGETDQLIGSIENTIKTLKDNHEIELWSMDGELLNSGVEELSKTVSVFNWSPDIYETQPDHNTYSAVFLISDGHLNGGRSPLDLSWSESLPIYPVYPLMPHTSVELKFINSSYSRDIEHQNLYEIEVEYFQEGLGGRMANIIVQDEFEQVLGQSPVKLIQSFGKLIIPIQVGGAEIHRLNISLELENGTLRSDNLLLIEEHPPLLNVLLLSDRVNDLHKFLLMNLSDSLYQIYSVVGTKAQNLDFMSSLSGQDLDLILLNQPGEQFLDGPVIDLLRSARDAFCPIIVFNDGAEPVESRWLNLIKLEQSKVKVPGEVRTPYWSNNSKGHPFYLGLLGRGFSAEEMIKFPPIRQEEYFLRFSGATMLEMGSSTVNDPVLILGDTPPLAVFNGSGYWKWFFSLQSRSAFGGLWEYLLLYLEDISNFKPVLIDLPMETAATGSYITAEISIKDLDKKNITTAELRVW
ncbi:hypothetical protein HQ531_06180, partial [bacterium]|nr:hypothetical protein [bacterium]